MRTSEVVWTHAGARLVGTLHQPDGAEPAPLLVVLHAANGGRRDYPFYQHLARDLPAAGIAALVFDRRGSGDSTGSFEEADFPLLAADAAAGIQALEGHPDLDTSRVGVYGISQGGWLAPLVAVRCPAVQCLVIVSGCGVSPAQQMTYSARTALRAAGYDEPVVAAASVLRAQVAAYYRGAVMREVVQAAIEAALAQHLRDVALFAHLLAHHLKGFP